MTPTQTPVQAGIVVATQLVAGELGLATNHAEGIVVSTTLVAGELGLATNHAEAIVG